MEGVGISPVLTAEADPTAANTRVTPAGEVIEGTAGDSLAGPVVVQVTDSAGVALGDVPVAWVAPDGGEVTPLGGRTDSVGAARARWTLGPKVGRQRLRVQVGNARLMPVFTVATTALPGEPVALSLRVGDRQAGMVGKALAQPIVLRAVDRHGNGVARAGIVVLTAAGRVADSLLSTDSTGQAKVRWTLGPTAGAQRLTARLAGDDTAVAVAARARAGAPETLMFVAPPSTVTAGRALAKPVVVQVADAHGNPVPGRSVVFTATAGTSSPARAVTDSTGRATVRWTLGRRAGAMSLVGKVAGSEVKGTLTVAAKVKARPAP